MGRVSGLRPRAARWIGLALIAALALPGCSAPTPTWVHVRGPGISRWTPPQEMSLEIGDSAWSITPEGGLGVAATELSSPARVRLVGVADCHVYVEFDAVPGSRYVIQLGSFEAPDAVTVQEVEAIEAAPGLVEHTGGANDCD